jgi:hypothetical protein
MITTDLHMTQLRKQIRHLEFLGENDFHRLEYELVSHYRRHSDDQEWIAVELTRKNVNSADPVTRSRVDEILAMLDHVHDPFITAVS